MNKLISLVTAALLTACSGEIDDQGNLIDIEQDQQAYLAKVTHNYQFGTRTGASHRQCDRSTTGQVCSVPSTKNLTWCINSGFTASDINLISDIVSSFDSVLTSWTFTYDSDLFTGQCQLTNNLQFTPGSCGTSGTAPVNIENYGCVTLSSASLTEGATGTTPVGQYQKHSTARAKIDITDINAKYSNATQRANAKSHAIMFTVLATIGLGSRSNGTTFANRPEIANFALGMMTSGEKCMAESFNTSNTTDFSIPTFGWSCGAD